MKNTGNFIEKVEELANDELIELQEQAKFISDAFWRTRNSSLESQVTKRRPGLGCRVDIRDNRLSIYWFTHRYYKQSNGRVRRTNEYITQNKSGGYSNYRLLKHALPEEEGLVIFTENAFSKIRARVEKLRKLKIWTHYYKKDMGI